MDPNEEALFRESVAQQELAKAGSVMARPEVPEWRKQNPALDAGMSLIDALIGLGGPTPMDALSGGAAKLAGHLGLAQLAQTLMGGGQPSGANEAGKFRDLGLLRAGGDLNPAQFVEQLQKLPGYDRFKELSQLFVRKGLGDEFPVYRGKGQTDPLMASLLNNQPMPAATAVSTDPNIARHFAETGAQMTRKPTYVMKAKATPEAVYGLVPRRDTHGHEAELVLNAALMTNPELAVKYFDAGGGMIQPTKPQRNWALPESTPSIEDTLNALLQK